MNYDLNLLFRSVAHPFTEYQIMKAKKLYREDHVECEICGVKPSFFGRNNDVHHLDPVHIYPEKACDQKNLRTLCRHCHWLFGHFKKWKNWNNKLNEMIVKLKLMYRYYEIKGQMNDQKFYEIFGSTH